MTVRLRFFPSGPSRRGVSGHVELRYGLSP